MLSQRHQTEWTTSVPYDENHIRETVGTLGQSTEPCLRGFQVMGRVVVKKNALEEVMTELSFGE